jgi:hypothetical protein
MRPTLRAAEQTPWLNGARIRAYNPTLALVFLVAMLVFGFLFVLEDIERFWPLAYAEAVGGFLALFVLGRWGIRAMRINNGAVALMTRGEELAAAGAFRAVVCGFYGRDVVGMSLHNLGVLALRKLDLSSAITLHRAALVVLSGFRFRWQTSIAQELARSQLAFVLAVAQADGPAEGGTSQAQLDEAGALLDATKASAIPQVIAYATRARAMVALRRGKLEDVVATLDEERALLRNLLPLNDAVLSEAMTSYALMRLGDAYRGAARPHASVLADDQARAYVRRIAPELDVVLAS